jgi:hypothetical protein
VSVRVPVAIRPLGGPLSPGLCGSYGDALSLSPCGTGHSTSTSLAGDMSTASPSPTGSSAWGSMPLGMHLPLPPLPPVASVTPSSSVGPVTGGAGGSGGYGGDDNGSYSLEMDLPLPGDGHGYPGSGSCSSVASSSFDEGRMQGRLERDDSRDDPYRDDYQYARAFAAAAPSLPAPAPPQQQQQHSQVRAGRAPCDTFSSSLAPCDRIQALDAMNDHDAHVIMSDQRPRHRTDIWSI